MTNRATNAEAVTAAELAVMAARIARDRHATDIVVLDLRDVSPVTDYFVICTGTSDRQMVAVGDEIAQEAAKRGHTLYRASGRETGQWILLDFVDVVVHVFDEAHRGYYDLELIWGDAPRVDWHTSESNDSGGRNNGSSD